jgi:hypothetical protein
MAGSDSAAILADCEIYIADGTSKAELRLRWGRTGTRRPDRFDQDNQNSSLKPVRKARAPEGSSGLEAPETCDAPPTPLITPTLDSPKLGTD